MLELKLKAYIKADNKIYKVLAWFAPIPPETAPRVFIDKIQDNTSDYLVNTAMPQSNYLVDGDNVVLIEYTEAETILDRLEIKYA